MSLDDLRAFLRVVDQGSFAAAASALGISRTTLRRQVDALEARTGVVLLERNSKGIALTEAGRRMVRGGRGMEQEFTALLSAIRQSAVRPDGELKVHLPSGLSPTGVGVVFGLLRSNWPGIRVRASFSEAPQLTDVAESDVVVWFGDLAPKGSWETRTFVVTRQRLLASEDYLAERGVPRTVQDLARHDMLAWLGPAEREPTLVTTRGESVPLEATTVTSNAHQLYECAGLGQGIAWVPDGGIAPSPGRPPLVRVLDHLVGRDVALRMGVPSKLAELPKVRHFLESFEVLRAFMFEQLSPPASATPMPAAARAG